MAESFDPKELDARVARADPDRHMAAGFAPAAGRARLIALYAFNDEIARVRERVSEPTLGDMRLQWWRDAVDEIYDPRRIVRGHEAALALRAAFADAAPPRLWIDRLINARARDLDAAPFTSLEEVLDYAEATAGTLVCAAAFLLAPEAELTPEAEAAMRHAGAAWAITGLLRAMPAHRAHGRPALPLDLTGLTGDDAAAAIAPVIALAREQYEFARAAYGAAPAECAPAMLYARLVPAYLKRIAAHGGVTGGAEPGRLRRQTLLVAAAARGRI